jgi:hypothetical protein
LAESSSFNIYLGEQPQEQAAINQSFNYGNFAVTGVLNPFSDNFLADTTLNMSIWTNGFATAPSGVFVSSGNQKLVTWSTPAVGFSLQDAGQLNGTWNDLTQGPNPTLYGLFGQAVSTNELPVGNSVFFRLLHRVATQIQVLLPGQTNAPNTVLGYVGTPTPISKSGQGLTTTTITVNACDITWHIVGGTSDSIKVTGSSDGGAYLPQTAVSLVNGTAIFSDPNGILFQTTGLQTVTAADQSNNAIAPATSAAVQVNN